MNRAIFLCIKISEGNTQLQHEEGRSQTLVQIVALGKVFWQCVGLQGSVDQCREGVGQDLTLVCAEDVCVAIALLCDAVGEPKGLGVLVPGTTSWPTDGRSRLPCQPASTPCACCTA